MAPALRAHIVWSPNWLPAWTVAYNLHHHMTTCHVSNGLTFKLYNIFLQNFQDRYQITGEKRLKNFTIIAWNLTEQSAKKCVPIRHFQGLSAGVSRWDRPISLQHSVPESVYFIVSLSCLSKNVMSTTMNKVVLPSNLADIHCKIDVICFIIIFVIINPIRENLNCR